MSYIYRCIGQPNEKCHHRIKTLCCQLVSWINWNPTELLYNGKQTSLIVMVLDEFCSMIVGAEFLRYTDKKYLIFAALNCRHVLQWQSFIENYDPTIPCHHWYIAMPPMMWCVANSKGQECAYFPLWFQWPWIFWVLTKSSIAWKCS